MPAETWYAHEQPQRLPHQQSLRTREGAHKGRPLRARTIWQRALACAHERAPTRGEGTHKGGGHPQGGRAPTRGAPTARTIWQRAIGCAHERAPTRGEGTHKGCPYGPNVMATSDRLCTREGAHKGGGHPRGGPLRARTIWQRAIGCAYERAPTRGALTGPNDMQQAIGCAHERAPTRGEGTHKGCAYGPERYGNER